MRWRPGILAGVLFLATAPALPAAASAATISQSFSSASIPLNGTATVTFTITGTDAIPPTVSFDDTLPPQLAVTAGSQITSCLGTTSGGATDLVFVGSAPTSGSTCTVSASVRGVQAGHWDDPTNETVGLGSAGTDASLDVVAPPSISAAFGRSLLGLDGTTSLTLTITNPNPTFALTGVGFTDTLPAGLVIAGSPIDTCGGAVTAVAGTDSAGLSDGQLPPGSSCTVSALVTATATGAVADTTTQVYSTEGGIGNVASAALTVIGAPTVVLSSPVGGHVYAFGQPVRASYSCAEDPGGPGVASCSGTVPTGALIDTGKTGAHSFTVTTASLDGGVASHTVFYSVAPDNRFMVMKRRVHPDGSVDFVIAVPGPGRIAVRAKAPGMRTAFAQAAASPRRAGRVHVTVRPSAAGRRALRRVHVLRVTVTLAYTPAGGSTRTVSLRLKVS